MANACIYLMYSGSVCANTAEPDPDDSPTGPWTVCSLVVCMNVSLEALCTLVCWSLVIQCCHDSQANGVFTIMQRRVFETMKENGVRPGPKVVHNLIMGSIINGRRDLAEAYAEEFRYNGVK